MTKSQPQYPIIRRFSNRWPTKPATDSQIGRKRLSEVMKPPIAGSSRGQIATMQTTSWTAVAVLLCGMFAEPVAASQYLGNNQRSGYTDVTVPAKPVLQWTYKERHGPRTAWPEPFGELQFIL